PSPPRSTLFSYTTLFRSRPVFIVNYPTSIKPFYMKKNPDNPKEYLCADVIAPEGYGEIFGGSEREGDYEVLKQQIEDAGLNLERSEEHTSELQSRFDLVC